MLRSFIYIDLLWCVLFSKAFAQVLDHASFFESLREPAAIGIVSLIDSEKSQDFRNTYELALSTFTERSGPLFFQTKRGASANQGFFKIVDILPMPYVCVNFTASNFVLQGIDSNDTPRTLESEIQINFKSLSRPRSQKEKFTISHAQKQFSFCAQNVNSIEFSRDQRLGLVFPLFDVWYAENHACEAKFTPEKKVTRFLPEVCSKFCGSGFIMLNGECGLACNPDEYIFENNQCKRCTSCDAGQYASRPCNIDTDTMCSLCPINDNCADADQVVCTFDPIESEVTSACCSCEENQFFNVLTQKCSECSTFPENTQTTNCTFQKDAKVIACKDDAFYGRLCEHSCPPVPNCVSNKTKCGHENGGDAYCPEKECLPGYASSHGQCHSCDSNDVADPFVCFSEECGYQFLFNQTCCEKCSKGSFKNWSNLSCQTCTECDFEYRPCDSNSEDAICSNSSIIMYIAMDCEANEQREEWNEMIALNARQIDLHSDASFKCKSTYLCDLDGSHLAVECDLYDSEIDLEVAWNILVNNLNTEDMLPLNLTRIKSRSNQVLDLVTPDLSFNSSSINNAGDADTENKKSVAVITVISVGSLIAVTLLIAAVVVLVKKKKKYAERLRGYTEPVPGHLESFLLSDEEFKNSGEYEQPAQVSRTTTPLPQVPPLSTEESSLPEDGLNNEDELVYDTYNTLRPKKAKNNGLSYLGKQYSYAGSSSATSTMEEGEYMAPSSSLEYRAPSSAAEYAAVGSAEYSAVGSAEYDSLGIGLTALDDEADGQSTPLFPGIMMMGDDI